MKTYYWGIKKHLVVDKTTGDVLKKWHYTSSMKPEDFIKTVFEKTLATELIRNGFKDLRKIVIDVKETESGYEIKFMEE